MKLQIALDGTDLDRAIALVEQVREYVDIIEIGTPLVYQSGMTAVRAMKARFPEKEVLADMKIVDGGDCETAEALEAGADYVTALALAEDITLRRCVETAERYGRRVVADMICVPDLPACVARLEALGVHGVAVHTGIDQQAAGRTPLEDLKSIAACAGRAEISVAGGIRPGTAAAYAALKPDVVIVGGGITHAEDPVAAARAIARQLRGAANGTESEGTE